MPKDITEPIAWVRAVANLVVRRGVEAMIDAIKFDQDDHEHLWGQGSGLWQREASNTKHTLN